MNLPCDFCGAETGPRYMRTPPGRGGVQTACRPCAVAAGGVIHEDTAAGEDGDWSQASDWCGGCNAGTMPLDELDDEGRCEECAAAAARVALLDSIEDRITDAARAAGHAVRVDRAATGTRYVRVTVNREDDEDVVLVARLADHDEAHPPRDGVRQWTITETHDAQAHACTLEEFLGRVAEAGIEGARECGREE